MIPGCWRSTLPHFWPPPRRPGPPLDGAGAPGSAAARPACSPARPLPQTVGRDKGRTGGGEASGRPAGTPAMRSSRVPAGGAAACARVQRDWASLEGQGVGAAPAHLPSHPPLQGSRWAELWGGGLSGELGREPFLHSRPCRSWRPEKAVRGTRHLRLLCHSSTQRSWPLRFRAAGDMSTNSREEVTPALGPRHVTTVTFTLCTCQWGCRCLPRLVHFHIQQTFPRAPPHALRQHWAGGSSLMPMTQPCPGWAKPTDLRTGVQGGVGERRDCRADTLMDTPENPGVGRGL